MNKFFLLLTLTFIGFQASAADFVISVQSGSSEKKMVYYDANNLKIGVAVMPVGVIGINALTFPNNNSRTYVSAGGANFSYDSFLDSNCKVPLINVVWGTPTKNSIMNVYNGFVKFLGAGASVSLNNEPVYKLSGGGNSGICSQSGTFTGTAHASSQYQTITIPFTIVAPVTTQYE